jgi:MFS family permease
VPASRAARASRRLPLVIASNGLLRVAGGASSVLAGVYLADLAQRGFDVGVALAGTLAAMSFGAELVSAVPLGMLADVLPARLLMTGSALLAALAALLFAVSHRIEVLVVSRTLEGLAAGAGVPALLAYVTDVTTGNKALRARVMSYFELSLLAGLALGGVVGTQLWSALARWAFAALALIYVAAAIIMFVGSAPGRRVHPRQAITALMRSLEQPALRRLAPVWLCINAIVGLWLGPALYFLLTHRSNSRQLLPGLFADRPTALGWLLLAYSLVFGSGLAIWSVALPRTDARCVSGTAPAESRRSGARRSSLGADRGHRRSHHGGEWLHAGGAITPCGGRRPRRRPRCGDGDLLVSLEPRRLERKSARGTRGSAAGD